MPGKEYEVKDVRWIMKNGKSIVERLFFSGGLEIW